MPPSPHSKASNGRDNSPYGPSWYDVYIIQCELQKRFPLHNITVKLYPNTSVNKKAGLVVYVVSGVGTILGACRFLDNGPESAKTAAAAFWTACTRAYHRLEAEEQRSLLEGGSEDCALDITPEGSPPEEMSD